MLLLQVDAEMDWRVSFVAQSELVDKIRAVLDGRAFPVFV